MLAAIDTDSLHRRAESSILSPEQILRTEIPKNKRHLCNLANLELLPKTLELPSPLAADVGQP
jgi:hypothetical protein